jgi:hypothetical protein
MVGIAVQMVYHLCLAVDMPSEGLAPTVTLNWSASCLTPSCRLVLAVITGSGEVL